MSLDHDIQGQSVFLPIFQFFCNTSISNSSFHSFAAFGCSKRDKLGSLCRYIAGDANLYTMFRVDGSAIECPFGTNHLTSGHPYSFSYDRGKGVCNWPESEMESCTDPSKLVFNYQACPNVPGSELMSKYFHGYIHFSFYCVSYIMNTTICFGLSVFQMDQNKILLIHTIP